MDPYCAFCKKTVEEIVQQTGGNLINHFCLERVKLVLEWENRRLFKYLKA